MSRPSPTDLAEMRAMVTRLERVIADATATVAELKAAIAAAEAQSASMTAAPAANPLVDAATPAPDRAPRPTPWSKRRLAATAAGRPAAPATTAPQAGNATTDSAHAATPQPSTRDTASASAADIHPGSTRATTPRSQTPATAAPLPSRPGDLSTAAEPGLSTTGRARPATSQPPVQPAPLPTIATGRSTSEPARPAAGEGDSTEAPRSEPSARAGRKPDRLDALPDSLRSLRVPTVARPQGAAGPRPANSPGADQHLASAPPSAARPAPTSPPVAHRTAAQPDGARAAGGSAQSAGRGAQRDQPSGSEQHDAAAAVTEARPGDTAIDSARLPAPQPPPSSVAPGASAMGLDDDARRTPIALGESATSQEVSFREDDALSSGDDRGMAPEPRSTSAGQAASGPSPLDALPEALRSLRVPMVARPQGEAGPVPGVRPAGSPGPDHHPPSAQSSAARTTPAQRPVAPPAATNPAGTQPAANQPATTQPATSHPVATQPGPTPPPGATPAAARSAATQRVYAHEPAGQPPTATQRDQSSDSDGHNLLAELAARHGLTLIGFDDPPLDPSILREFAEAVGDMLARYPITLQGIEIRHPAGTAPPRTLGAAAVPRADPAPLWLVLDSTALVPRPTAAPRSRKWLRRRRIADRTVYTAVVRAYGCALDAAGNFRARQEAQRLLVTESLRGGPDLAFSPLNPAQALVDAFTEVVLHDRRAGAQAKALHDILVTMGRREATDVTS